MYNLAEMNNNFALTYSSENRLKQTDLSKTQRIKDKNIHMVNKINKKELFKKSNKDVHVSSSENTSHQKQNYKKNNNSYNLNSYSYFWIMYVMIYGIEDYNLLTKKQYFSKEQEIRFVLVDKIHGLSKKKIDFLKAHKIKPQTIISELGNSSPLTLDTFIGLCIILNMNVLLVKNCIAHKLLNNENDKNVWLVNVNKIRIDKCVDIEKVNESRYYLVDNISKPFKSISGYKADELRLICEKVGIVTKNEKNKNKTKKDLYQELIDKIEI
jgi:hypothetical protein